MIVDSTEGKKTSGGDDACTEERVRRGKMKQSGPVAHRQSDVSAFAMYILIRSVSCKNVGYVKMARR